MRHAIVLLASAMALSACNKAPPPSANVEQADENAVLGQAANEQAALATGIEQEGDADANSAGNADPGDTGDAPDGAVSYSCDNGVKAEAIYGADDGTVRLTIGGKTMALASVPAASGAKYQTGDGLVPGSSLTWWTKGDTDAMLIQAPKGGKETSSNCKASADGDGSQ